MFAGPNGSGKSTLKDELEPHWLGVYVNADDLEATIRTTGEMSLAAFGMQATQTELSEFFACSTLLAKAGLVAESQAVTLHGDVVRFGSVAVNSYYASVLVDFIRNDLLRRKVSFTFETVMSAADKVAFFCKARASGFRTYLYYVATEDPEINVSRVAHRVSMGKHNVPPEKIIERYHRSLDLLADAVACADRAYVFDNSGEERVWVAEVTDGNELEMKTDLMPYWFKAALIDKFSNEDTAPQ
jgi:predicted ABC-type ATPase